MSLHLSHAPEEAIRLSEISSPHTYVGLTTCFVRQHVEKSAFRFCSSGPCNRVEIEIIVDLTFYQDLSGTS